MSEQNRILDSLLVEHGFDINTITDSELDIILRALPVEELDRINSLYEDYVPYDEIEIDDGSDDDDPYGDAYQSSVDNILSTLETVKKYEKGGMREVTNNAKGSGAVDWTIPEFFDMQVEKMRIEANQDLYDLGYGYVQQPDGEWSIVGLNHPSLKDYKRPEDFDMAEWLFDENYMGWIYDLASTLPTVASEYDKVIAERHKRDQELIEAIPEVVNEAARYSLGQSVDLSGLQGRNIFQEWYDSFIDWWND